MNEGFLILDFLTQKLFSTFLYKKKNYIYIYKSDTKTTNSDNISQFNEIKICKQIVGIKLVNNNLSVRFI